MKRMTVLLVLALVAGISFVLLAKTMNFDTARELRDCQSMQTFAATESDKLVAAIRNGEAEECELRANPALAAERDKQKADAEKAVADKAQADKQNAETAAAAAAAKADPNNPDNWARYERELIATRPEAEKMSKSSFGPKFALQPALRGTQIDQLSAAQFVDEMKYRMPMSPVLVAATGAALNMWGENEIDSKIALYLGNRAEWQSAVAAVSARLDEEITKGATVVSLPAGDYTAAYAIVGADGVPNFGVEDGVNRPEAFNALRLSNAVDLRMICGAQQYSKHSPQAKRLPAPSKGMARNNEGSPVVAQASGSHQSSSGHQAQTSPQTSGSTPSTGSTSTPSSTSTPTPTSTSTQSLAPKTGSNPVATPGESHSVSREDGSKVSNGLQTDPQGDARRAADAAAADAATKKAAADAGAAGSSTHSGAGSTPQGQSSGSAGVTGNGGNQSGSVWAPTP